MAARRSTRKKHKAAKPVGKTYKQFTGMQSYAKGWQDALTTVKNSIQKAELELRKEGLT